ncbi:hypothetical protein J2S06_003116 [Bacillus alveayuensis]|uniref:Uncharacterized protein n=1 Tax=Aeribacillus alveayuensis TaxID=279215 RepID=A0ABT9VSK4_9BACI|nr:hypothetical protein [Bacillus alveayuensis]
MARVYLCSTAFLRATRNIPHGLIGNRRYMDVVVFALQDINNLKILKLNLRLLIL